MSDHPSNETQDASSPNATTDRRAFLGRLLAVGVAGVGLSGMLAACGGEETVDTAENQMGADAETGAAEPVAECEDYTGLSEQELQKREALNYVAESPNANEVCDNCRFWVEPEGDDVCGGCTLFAGPVNPGGWCSSWAAMPS